MKDRITVIGAGVIGGSVVRSLLKSKYQGKSEEELMKIAYRNLNLYSRKTKS